VNMGTLRAGVLPAVLLPVAAVQRIPRRRDERQELRGSGRRERGTR